VTTTSVREPRTYQPAQDSGRGPSFLRDLFNAQVRNDPEALSRLNRHGDEQRVEAPDLVERAVSTGGVAAFTPPAYLVSQWAELSRAGRPIANLCNRSIPLPATGMKVTIPRVTTGTEIEVQAAQGDTLGNQDLDDTALEIPVVSAGGYVDVTWQSLDRGELVQEVVLADLAADYATKLDQQVIYGTGLSGQALGLLGTSGIGAVTYTATTPSLVEMYPKVAELVGKIAGTRFTGATAIAMTPDLWYWMRGVLAEDNRPAIPDSDVGPVNAFGVGGSLEYVETAGKLFAPVVLDGNIPKNLGTGTNETAIIAADWRDVMLLEENGGLPVQMRFDAPLAHQATARLVAWGYFAFTAGRQPSAVAKLTGTGLIRP
jgi:HK97 family phage major capsid protein